MASSSNPIAESATISNNYYHVFLNHCGSDVKETLATHLHKRLSDKGLRVFLDKEELQEGDHIPSHLKGAIGSASVHIAIFSPNYAESSWCLNELLLMLESRKTIIPIFYGVKPDVLRWTLGGNGVYARHLSILEGKKSIDSRTRLQKPRYDTNTMEEWRRALSQAADLTGFVVEAEAFNSDDSQLVDNVVERVLEKLPKTPLNVSKYPTGLADKVEDLERTVLMPQESGETRIVGIVGLGGVGKTTLAKEIFNRERSKYHRSCFLPDVREKTDNRSFNSVMSTLANELTGSNVQINSTAEGIEELRRRVSSCHAHALLILDDVNHIHQLDVLLSPVKDALSPSSLILVTSRNKDVLTSFGIVETSIYKLEGLNPQHSQELFCSHAFGQPHPAAQFERLVEIFLVYCQGLPLSLQVIGSLLHGKDDLKYWKEQLHKISKILPEDIQSILKLSYDGLDPEEKEIFLDIACFFTGEKGIRPDRDTAIRIWDGSGWNGWLGLRNLQNRCLVDVDVEEGRYRKIEYLRMHDHLRDLGRDLAKKDPLRGHRLWRPAENLLHNLFDQSAVRGLLCLQRNQLVDPRRDSRKRRRLLDQNPMELGNRSISMSRLELLRTRGDCLKDILRRVQSPEYLIWLQCHDFPFASLPRWIPMERLSVLYMQGDKLRWLWADRNSQAPLQLRQLEITARLLKIPKSIGQLKYLEKIVVRPLQGLINRTSSGGQIVVHKVPLETLPDDFCDLQCLEHLELAYCSEMKSLPESFGNLKNLQHLDLSGCSKLRTLPNSFGNLKQLKHLILIHCTGLTISSETLGNITTLELIDMRYSIKIEVLPPQVSHQRYLSELCLTGTNIRELPSAIGDLRDLKILVIGGPSLEMLPPWLGCLRSLKELAIADHRDTMPDWFCNMDEMERGWDCTMCYSSKQLKCLPDSIGELNQLEKLSLNATGVECLPPCIMALNNLQRLEVEYSPLRELPFKRDSLVECMLGLTDLWLVSTRISEIAFGKGICPNLQRLHIHNCKRLAEVGTLPNTLMELNLWDCFGLKNIEGLCGLAKLSYLKIRGCPNVEELSGFGTLKSLNKLRLDGCGGITGIRGLQQLTKLRDLIVSDCCVLEELAGIEHLIGLRKLYVSKCPNIHCGEEVLKHLCQREEEGLLDLRYDPLGNVTVSMEDFDWEHI